MVQEQQVEEVLENDLLWVAEFAETLINGEWSALREQGNAAFRSGKWQECIEFYSEALDKLDLANPPRPPNSTQVVGGQTFNLRYPSRPAAICLSNRSAARLKLGDAAGALADAKLAVQECPEFLKGHGRCELALRALGRNQEAQKVAAALQDFEEISQRVLSRFYGMYGVGWISDVQLLWVYCRYTPLLLSARYAMPGADIGHDATSFRTDRVISKAAEEAPSGRKTTSIHACLVPFVGGQWLALGIDTRTASGATRRRHASLEPCDEEHSDDLLHGRGTATAITVALIRATQFIDVLQEKELDVRHLQIGQGLLECKSDWQRALRARHPNLTVTTSSSTFAEEVNENVANVPFDEAYIAGLNEAMLEGLSLFPR